MPDILALPPDGWQASGTRPNWTGTGKAVGARNTIGLGVPDTDDVSKNSATSAIILSGPGGGYTVLRAFFNFNSSGIGSTVSSATLKLYAANFTAANIIVVKSAHNPSSASDDWFNTWLDEATDVDWDADDVTEYSGEIDVTSTSAYTEITLNSTALSDLENDDTFVIAVLDYTHDYLNSAPTSTASRTGWFFSDQAVSGDGSKVPKISYTLGASGYANNVSGVATADISKVNGIATADIEKINGI